MENKLRDLLQEKRPVIATRINSTWPVIAETVGITGYYDYIEFLGEYAPFDQYDLENVARACELHGMSCIIKTDYANRDFVAQKAIAAGFSGILYTDHTQAEEIEETLKGIKPATPEEKGRMGLVNRRWYKNEPLKNQMGYAQDLLKIVAGFMIEKKEAVQNIEAICQVKGVDFVQFGPADYSLNCGFNKNEEPERVREAEIMVIHTALKYGISPRVEINSASEAVPYIKLGVRHFALGSELKIEKTFWQESGSMLRNALLNEREE